MRHREPPCPPASSCTAGIARATWPAWADTARKRLRAALLALLPLAAAAPATAETTLRAVMHSPLRLTDPHATTAYITAWHGYMIYDTLIAVDGDNALQPQMLEKWDVSEDGKTYTLTLREGLAWHDGQPVTAEDCVASIRRWAAIDAMGQKLLKFTERIEAVDARRLRFVMTQPTDLALRALAKPSTSAPFILPKRVAEQPPGKPITDMTGSGPFKLVEFKPGVKTVYVKNAAYVPRPEPASGLAGGKRVKVDRVEWLVMPDHLTTANALTSGEIDLVEQFPYDLLPMLEGDAGIKVEPATSSPAYSMYRFNFLHPPFNDRKIRQAAMYAIGQEDVMKALVGNPKYWRTCASLWGCGTPMQADAGQDMVVPSNIDKARALLKEAGYDNTPVLMLHATDVASLSPQPVVMAQALRQAGFNVTLAAMDWQSVASRRASRALPADGGWSILNTNMYTADLADPVRTPMAAADGDKAWYGWPDFPQVEALRDQYALSSDPAEQKRIAAELQRVAIDEGLYVPLGQSTPLRAYSSKLSGLPLAPAPVFWGVDKTP